MTQPYDDALLFWLVLRPGRQKKMGFWKDDDNKPPLKYFPDQTFIPISFPLFCFQYSFAIDQACSKSTRNLVLIGKEIYSLSEMQVDFMQDEEETFSGLFLNGVTKAFQDGKRRTSGSEPWAEALGNVAYFPSLPQISFLDLGKST